MKKILSLSAAAAAALALPAQKAPNILFIMCDDMGFADLGCYGQTLIATPHLDRLAAQGMRFTQAYAGSPVSAPSRASFMTGQHTGHTHVRGNKEYWGLYGTVDYGKHKEYKVAGQEPYDTAHVIIPEILKDRGYRTGMFGKWAGGYEGSASTPDKRGIDEYYGFVCQFQAHLYYPNFLNSFSRAAGDTAVRREIQEENLPYDMVGGDYAKRPQYSSDRIHQRALRWLDEQTTDQPFLGIFTYTLPHAELAQPDDSIVAAYRGRFDTESRYGGSVGSRYNPTDEGHTQFAAMVTRLDAQVGEIMAKLEEKGLAENTIVFFTSDNGAHEEAGADPAFFNRDRLLKGNKRSLHEGGIRVPFIVRWSGRIRGGQVTDQPVVFYDMMPTFAELAGIENYEKKYANPRLKKDHFDGVSIVPTLLGQGEQAQHDHLYWEFHETDMMAVRRGDWKLLVKKGKCFLYHLPTDLHEDNDVAAEYPQKVEELKAILLKEHEKSTLFPITLPQK